MEEKFFFFLVREGKEVYRFWGGNRGNETLVMGFRYLKSIFYIWWWWIKWFFISYFLLIVIMRMYFERLNYIIEYEENIYVVY